jgi:uncharacterized protein YecT (DUF1311 family)
MAGSLSCTAQQGKLPPCMQTAQTQAELNVCAGNKAKLVDTQRKVLYEKLLSKLSGNMLAAAKIKAAEKAWISYRDAYVEATYPEPNKQMAYGTMFPMQCDLLIADLTEEHVLALKNLLKNYEQD